MIAQGLEGAILAGHQLRIFPKRWLSTFCWTTVSIYSRFLQGTPKASNRFNSRRNWWMLVALQKARKVWALPGFGRLTNTDNALRYVASVMYDRHHMLVVKRNPYSKGGESSQFYTTPRRRSDPERVPKFAGLHVCSIQNYPTITALVAYL